MNEAQPLPPFRFEPKNKIDDRYQVFEVEEIEQVTGAGGKPIFKLAVRSKDGLLYATAYGTTALECVRRAKKIAAADAMVAELEPTCTVLKTVATVLAQSGKMQAARALDDTWVGLLRVVHRAKGGAA